MPAIDRVTDHRGIELGFDSARFLRSAFREENEPLLDSKGGEQSSRHALI
jgi:hypothetical protein